MLSFHAAQEDDQAHIRVFDDGRELTFDEVLALVGPLNDLVACLSSKQQQEDRPAQG